MLIDPQGLFYGDRISECSDDAQLHFARLLAGSNGFGRIELSISKLHSTVYAKFQVKPTREQIQNWVREYHANFLLFTYRGQDGSMWGQWNLSKRYLPKYKTAQDNRSPEPNNDEFAAYQRSYVDFKKQRYEAEKDYIDISEDFGNVQKPSEGSKGFSQGIGIGIGKGGGVGKDQKTSRGKTASDPRHVPFRLACQTYAEFKRVPFVWDGSEGRALDQLLKAIPGMTLAEFQRCINHRAKSVGVTHGDRPRDWIPKITKYAEGPLDEFGKLQGAGNGNHGKTGHSIDAAREALEILDRRAGDRASPGEAGHPASGEVGYGGLLGAG